jgi:hypothetical protein
MTPVEHLLEYLNYRTETICLVVTSIRDGSYRFLSPATSMLITRALIQIGEEHQIYWREPRSRNHLADTIVSFFIALKSPHRLLVEVEWL